MRLAVLAVVFTAIGIYLYLNWEKFSDVFTSVSATKITLVFFVDFFDVHSERYECNLFNYTSINQKITIERSLYVSDEKWFFTNML